MTVPLQYKITEQSRKAEFYKKTPIFRKEFDLSRATLGVPTWSYSHPSSATARAGAPIPFAPPTLVLSEAEHYSSLLVITMKKSAPLLY